MPTIKQKLVATKLVGTGGNISQAMREAGYKEGTINTPQKVTESKGFQQLMTKILPENLVLKTHKQLLTAGELKSFVFSNSLTDDEIKKVVEKIKGAKLIKIQRNSQNAHAYFTAPDYHSRKDGVDMAYKLGGKYSAEKIDVNSQKLEDALDRMAEIIPKSQ